MRGLPSFVVYPSKRRHILYLMSMHVYYSCWWSKWRRTDQNLLKFHPDDPLSISPCGRVREMCHTHIFFVFFFRRGERGEKEEISWVMLIWCSLCVKPSHYACVFRSDQWYIWGENHEKKRRHMVNPLLHSSPTPGPTHPSHHATLKCMYFFLPQNVHMNSPKCDWNYTFSVPYSSFLRDFFLTTHLLFNFSLTIDS